MICVAVLSLVVMHQLRSRWSTRVAAGAGEQWRGHAAHGAFRRPAPPCVAALSQAAVAGTAVQALAWPCDRSEPRPLIGTHDGTFHCDEALACAMLKMLPEYRDAAIVRTRDPEELERCSVVVDVGATYDPARSRFDHHQRGPTLVAVWGSHRGVSGERPPADRVVTSGVRQGFVSCKAMRKQPRFFNAGTPLDALVCHSDMQAPTRFDSTEAQAL